MKGRTTQIADPGELRRFVSLALHRVGVPVEDAELTAEILVDADLRGIETHGVINLHGYYVNKLRAGLINNRPKLKVVSGSPTTMLLDADNGLGFVAGQRGMSEAIRMAREHGTGWVSACNSNHCGAGAYYVLMAARQNMIGLHCSSGGSSVAGPSGTGRLIGNNLIAAAAPAGKGPPFVLDMAPTMAIANKLLMLEWDGKSMPEGWAIDSRGRPITDPRTYQDTGGAVLPLGSTATHGAHKGFGLLLLSDILTGMLSGDGGSMLRRKGRESHFFCALRIDAFVAVDEFNALMDAMIEKLHAAPTAEGAGSMRYPGERSDRVYRERCAHGIPFRPQVVEDLEQMSEELDLPMHDIWMNGS
jgi:LDH2 family malate/lactate/ureidoglycolate dehydrogenase